MKKCRVFYFDGLDEYIVKINMKKWLLRYQNVGRVFYNEKIRQLVEEEGLDRIFTFKKYLYHIPGQPEVLNDENYIVIAEHIPDLPDPEENLQRFKALSHDQSFIDQVMQVINQCGLWSINEHNTFVTDDGQCVFIDTEQPGMGGSNDEDFFHKNPQQIINNAQSGLEAFCNLISD